MAPEPEPPLPPFSHPLIIPEKVTTDDNDDHANAPHDHLIVTNDHLYTHMHEHHHDHDHHHH